MGEMYVNKDTSIINKINDVYNNISLKESLHDLDKNNTFSESYMDKLQEKIRK